MSELASGSFSGFSPVPSDIIAEPCQYRLSSAQIQTLQSLQPGQLNQDFFPPFSANFKIDPNWAPLADPSIDIGYNSRSVNERTLNAPVGQWVDQLSTEQIPTNGNMAQALFGWIPSRIGNETPRFFVPSQGDPTIGFENNDYWETKAWKYERAFFVTEGGYWFMPFSYTKDTDPEVENNWYLFELATKLDGQNPEITEDTPAAIVRFYTPNVGVELSDLTTKQLNTLQAQNPLQQRSSPDNYFNLSQQNPQVDYDEIATWTDSYDAIVFKNNPITYLSYLPLHALIRNGLGRKQDLAGEAFNWHHRLPQLPSDEFTSSRYNMAQKGALYQNFGVGLRPMYEIGTERGMNLWYPARNAYAFGDFHGLGFAGIGDGPQSSGTRIDWHTLCKIQTTKHYLQVLCEEMLEWISEDKDFFRASFAKITTDPGEPSKYEAVTLTKEDTAPLLFPIAQWPNFITTPNTQTIFNQIVGFTKKQAQDCFPDAISLNLNGNFTQFNSALKFVDPTLWQSPEAYFEYNAAFKFSNYTVVRTPWNGDPQTTSTETYSDWFPFTPQNDYGNGLFSYGVFKLLFIKDSNSETPFYTYTIEIGEDFTLPYVRSQTVDASELWTPTNEAVQEMLETLQSGVASFLNNLINSVGVAGSFEILNKQKLPISQHDLFGLQKVGILRIRWTPATDEELNG